MHPRRGQTGTHGRLYTGSFSLDMRRGSQAGRGALVGGAAGLAGSLLLILGESLSDRPAQDDIPRAFFVGTITVVWAGLGALIGASLDNWRAVPP